MNLLLVFVGEFDFDEAFFEQVIEFVASQFLLTLLINFLQLYDHLAFLGTRIVHVGIKEVTDLLVIIL